jgi:sugar phosphate isomerase/epimerase
MRDRVERPPATVREGFVKRTGRTCTGESTPCQATERIMSEEGSKETKEAEMTAAIQRIAKKHGCKVEIDYEKHTMEFDCPTKEAEVDLAMEIKKMMGDDEN